MDENVLRFNKVLLDKVSEKLKKNGFNDVWVFDDKQQAKQKIVDIIPEKSQVGVGGSMTVVELGIIDELKNKNVSIVKHEHNMTLEQRREVWRKAIVSDFYIASPQAITYDGKMFFIDKYGNRLAAIIFGPGKVILIAGYNKLVPDENSALWRIRNIAAVKNTYRLHLKTPCTTVGYCTDCQTEDRICNVVSFLLKRPPATD
ncbi:MAG: lactate utilization protein, partial [Endomicrobiia bacterium]